MQGWPYIFLGSMTKSSEPMGRREKTATPSSTLTKSNHAKWVSTVQKSSSAQSNMRSIPISKDMAAVRPQPMPGPLGVGHGRLKRKIVARKQSWEMEEGKRNRNLSKQNQQAEVACRSYPTSPAAYMPMLRPGCPALHHGALPGKRLCPDRRHAHRRPAAQSACDKDPEETDMALLISPCS